MTFELDICLENCSMNETSKINLQNGTLSFCISILNNDLEISCKTLNSFISVFVCHNMLGKTGILDSESVLTFFVA